MCFSIFWRGTISIDWSSRWFLFIWFNTVSLGVSTVGAIANQHPAPPIATHKRTHTHTFGDIMPFQFWKLFSHIIDAKPLSNSYSLCSSKSIPNFDLHFYCYYDYYYYSWMQDRQFFARLTLSVFSPSATNIMEMKLTYIIYANNNACETLLDVICECMSPSSIRCMKVCVCVLNSELFLWRVQIIHCSNDWRLDFPIRKVREKRFKWLNECVLGSVCVRCAWTRIWRIAPDEHEWDEINNKLFTLFRLGKIPSLHPYLIPPLQPQP